MSWIITGTQRYQPAALLDQFPGAAAAYSLRNLVGTSNPAVVRVRRDNDDAEQDFTATEVSDGTLAAWVGAGNDGFVRTWYDQSGNNYDATQATAAEQPKIVDSSGGLVTENGEAALTFDGSNDTLPTTCETQGVFSLYYVSKINNTTQDRSVVSSYADSSNKHFLFWYDKDDNLYRNDVYASTGTPDRLDVSSYNSSQSLIGHIATKTAQKFIKNNNVVVTSNYSFTNLGAGSGSFLTIGSQAESVKYFSGSIQEIIYYPSDQSANRVAIEANINAHYSIY